MKVEEYIRDDKTSPFKKFFNSLDVIAAAKVLTAISRLESGNTSNVKWFDGIGEYKIDWGAGYRIYLTKEGKQLIILFGGGTKKTQSSDIEHAKRLY
jgi:putative addiction module killer protein